MIGGLVILRSYAAPALSRRKSSTRRSIQPGAAVRSSRFSTAIQSSSADCQSMSQLDGSGRGLGRLGSEARLGLFWAVLDGLLRRLDDGFAGRRRRGLDHRGGNLGHRRRGLGSDDWLVRQRHRLGGQGFGRGDLLGRPGLRLGRWWFGRWRCHLSLDRRHLGLWHRGLEGHLDAAGDGRLRRRRKRARQQDQQRHANGMPRDRQCERKANLAHFGPAASATSETLAKPARLTTLSASISWA